MQYPGLSQLESKNVLNALRGTVWEEYMLSEILYNSHYNSVHARYLDAIFI